MGERTGQTYGADELACKPEFGRWAFVAFAAVGHVGAVLVKALVVLANDGRG
ncbi:hypothetical protein MNVM_02000 [Mycobacterium novum]|uniref:Uncharacterized protein n=1 Tax=Mycobacterium novum TaxID=2492438 RepID=A0A7I7JIG1_9MYCO|nr:hypothetical protein MNVM_02000 [Mycobacterium novum]